MRAAVGSRPLYKGIDVRLYFGEREGDLIMKWRIKKLKYRSECCWCRKKISDFSPVYGVNAKFRKDVETPPVEDEGYVIELAVKKVWILLIINRCVPSYPVIIPMLKKQVLT